MKHKPYTVSAEERQARSERARKRYLDRLESGEFAVQLEAMKAGKVRYHERVRKALEISEEVLDTLQDT